MSTTATPHGTKSTRDGTVDAWIPTPLFSRWDNAQGHGVVVEIVGCDEDLRSIGSLPTMDRMIDWRIRRLDQVADPDALFLLVIWNASFSRELALCLVGCRRPSCVAIVCHSSDHPPPVFNGRPVGRLCFEGSVRKQLCKLIPSLVVPIAYEGLVCVDYADLELAISRGGKIRQFVRQSDDVESAVAIVRDVAGHLRTLRQEASVCVSMLVGRATLTWKLVDDVLGGIQDLIHPEVLLVTSAVAHEGSGACITVLTSSGPSYHCSPIKELKQLRI